MSRTHPYVYLVALLAVFLGGGVCGGDPNPDSDGGPVVDPELCTRTERDADTNEIRELRMSGRDDRGRLVLQQVDTGADGAIEWEAEYGYDAQGRLSTKRVDDDGDGQWNTVTTFAYDAEGRKATDDISYPQAGGNLRSTYHYDDEDRVTWIDDDYGSHLGKRSYAYDGRVTRVVNDERVDGSPDRIDEYHFNADWHLTTELQDWDGNGAWDARWSYGYDGAGRQTSRQLDEGDDGRVEKRWTTRYDESGSPVSGTLDEDGDGTVDVRTTYSEACRLWER